MISTVFNESEIVDIVKKYYDIREPVEHKFILEQNPVGFGGYSVTITLQLSTEVDKT